MTVNTATLIMAGDHTALELTTDEGKARIELPKPLFLANGFVILTGPDVQAGKVTTQNGYLQPAPGDGRWTTTTISNTTSELQVVELARRYAAGDFDEIEPGSLVDVPTFEEADAARWTYRGGWLQRA